MDEYVVCKHCKEKLEKQTYIKITGDVKKPVLGSSSNQRRDFVRRDALIDAIAKLKYKPAWFIKNYIGVKNYGTFGDQRSDHEHGMGPRHGSIVFKIELKPEFRNENEWLGVTGRKQKALGYLESALNSLF